MLGYFIQIGFKTVFAVHPLAWTKQSLCCHGKKCPNEGYLNTECCRCIHQSGDHGIFCAIYTVLPWSPLKYVQDQRTFLLATFNLGFVTPVVLSA